MHPADPTEPLSQRILSFISKYKCIVGSNAIEGVNTTTSFIRDPYAVLTLVQKFEIGKKIAVTANVL